MECINGIQLNLIKNSITINNLGPNINTEYDEYAPYVSADEEKLFFTSRRLGDHAKNIDKNDGLHYEDIFLSFRRDCFWSPAVNAGNNINSRGHDAICGVFEDGHTMIIFKGGIRRGDLFYVKYNNGE